ncbi:MAG: hypothetical protein JXN60_05275 [Lentisphaerae bacterium]|nr:hypothetical protein [Lentisphaerota bacterium]
MKLLHRLVAIIIMALTGIGIGAIAVVARDGMWQKVYSLLVGGQFVALCAGIGSVCITVLFVLTGFQRKKKEKFLSFDQNGGPVSISTEAIADYIAKLVEEFPSVVKMKPVIVPVRGAIDVVVDVKVKAGPQIHEICELIQQRVRESVTAGLGIAEIRRVEVSVTEIVSEHRPV